MYNRVNRVNRVNRDRCRAMPTRYTTDARSEVDAPHGDWRDVATSQWLLGPLATGWALDNGKSGGLAHQARVAPASRSCTWPRSSHRASLPSDRRIGME